MKRGLLFSIILGAAVSTYALTNHFTADHDMTGHDIFGVSALRVSNVVVFAIVDSHTNIITDFSIFRASYYPNLITNIAGSMDSGVTNMMMRQMLAISNSFASQVTALGNLIASRTNIVLDANWVDGTWDGEAGFSNGWGYVWSASSNSWVGGPAL